MAYADSDYYFHSYGGACSEDEIESLLDKAERTVDMLTGRKIAEIGFENLSENIRERVKRAVCAEADYIEQNGEDGIDGNEPAEVTIGRFRYVCSSSDGGSSRGAYSAEAISLLEASGLMGRRMAVLQ